MPQLRESAPSNSMRGCVYGLKSSAWRRQFQQRNSRKGFCTFILSKCSSFQDFMNALATPCVKCMKEFISLQPPLHHIRICLTFLQARLQALRISQARGSDLRCGSSILRSVYKTLYCIIASTTCNACLVARSHPDVACKILALPCESMTHCCRSDAAFLASR